MKQFQIFLLIINICKIISLQNPPDNYSEVDNPFRDDIEYTTEKDHHIITAVSSNGYVDYYKGIYYKKKLCCHWIHNGNGFVPSYAENVLIPKYLEIQNINDTNLKEMHKYGCLYKPPNILIDYRRSAEDALVSITLRLTSLEEKDIEFQFGLCDGFEDNRQEKCIPSGFTILDTYNITNNSFLIYTFKFDNSSYFRQSDNFEIAYSHKFKANKHLRFFIMADTDNLYINSYIVSVDLFRYVLSYSGHAHNYCTRHGCLDDYSCVVEESNNGKSPKYYGCQLYYWGYFTTECSLFGCIPGAFCSPDTVCIECDYQCKTCFDKNYMNCKSCYSIAIYPYWMYDNQFDKGTQCIFEFYPMNKVESGNINIPIPLSYRITFEFWIFIHNPRYLTNKDLRSSLSSFILKDFFTFSIHHNEVEQDFNSTVLILTPFEYFYPFKKDYTTVNDFEKYKNDYSSLQYLQIIVYNVTSKWIYVKGGLSYTHKKMFINDEEKDLDYIPIYDNDDNTKYNYLMRKFYRRYETTSLRIQGFEYINTDVYIRNLNFYSDYMFNKINSPNYFNMHEIGNILIYPQLILSIPFTNVTVDPVKMYVRYEVYDYSGQYTDLNKNPDQVIKNEIKMTLIRDYLAPSKNFYRLNFLHFKNAEFETTDLFKQNLNIECSNSEGQIFCFEDNQPYICDNRHNLIFNNNNITISSCVDDCILIDEESIVHKYMRLPNIKINQDEKRLIPNNLCTYECNSTIVESCPTIKDSDIKQFKCNESYYSFFYQCLNKDEYPAKESALQFSGSLNTKSIYFPFNKDLYNFYIEIWFHTDLLTQEEPPLYTKYIFMTNNQEIYYDVSKQQFILKVYNDDGIVSTFNLNQKIYYYGWNHLIVYTKEELVKEVVYTTFIISLANNLIETGTIQGKSCANKICFCNTDSLCCGRVSKAIWFDVFVREIKVWDARYVNYYTINDYDKYSFIIPGGLLQMYNLTSGSLDQNTILDLRHPNEPNFAAIFPYEDDVINPDGDINYNIGWNFNWNDINYPFYIVSTKLMTENNRVKIFETNKCYEGCLKCFGFNKFSCYSCQPGYALNGATCTKTSDNLSTYYYVNPLRQGEGFDPNSELELDFRSLNLDNYATITLFFYIKIYGFTQDQIDLYENNITDLFKVITLSEKENEEFILYYNITSDSIILKLGEKIQYKYTGILSKFGNWIPISISAFRANDYNFRKDFTSMTFDNLLLPYLGFDDDNEKIFSKFPFDTFKISKYLIAHIADVTLYDLFIINAFGYAQHKYLIDGNFSSTSGISRNNIIIKTFKMFHIVKDLKNNSDIGNETNNIEENDLDSSINENIGSNEVIIKDCISLDDILNSDTILPRITCKEDYLSFIDQKCKDNEFVQFTTSNLPPSCVESASKCENIVQVTTNMKSNCDYLYASCDTKSSNSINNLIYTYSPRNAPNDNYIVCGDAHGLDLARFESATIPNITSPIEQFKMEFWFLSQSYVGNNFNSISINWENHIKIEVYYNSDTGLYGARCNPMNSDNLMQFEYTEASNAQNRWRYIVCGVNAIDNKAYMTNLQIENRREIIFIPTITLTNDLTTLSISENSNTNYGVTYLKELRLWDCYDCASDRAFVVYSRDDPFFGNVVNYFKFESSTGFLQDYHTGYPDPNVFVQFQTKTEFYGYGLLEPIPDTPNCNEGGQMYFSIKMGEGCDTMFNFNIFTKDVVFEDIPAARTNSYTMEFWFYVESADDFTKGMNLIYEDHMTISTLAHNINDNDLDVYCFPQAYRDHLDDIFGENITKRYEEAENKYGFTFENGFSKWNYVRCSYSYDLLKYYINDKQPKDINPEIFFNNYLNDKPFKMFMNNLVKFKINSSRYNFARYIIQNINIYRDYIPQTIKTKYIKMDQYITNSFENPYYPLLFSVNFPQNYDIITDKLKYYVTDFDINPEKNNLDHFLADIDLKSYKTYPLYDPFKLCNYGQIYNETNKLCRSIMQPNNCDKVKTFCIDTQKFFWCPSGQYLDINELKCNRDCPDGYTRPPDIRNGYGMCYINASDKNYRTYPKLNAELEQGIYETKFSCIDGYTLVNYNCIPNGKIEKSGLYFSSKYKFSNLIASYNKLGIPITNYYVDFWFLFDLTEEYRFNIPNDKQRYTIFIAYPHFITRFKNKIQYNNGFILLDYYDIINVEDIKNKWNHVVLENYQIDGKTPADTFKYINIYWNNDYNNPLLSLKINNINSYALAQIAFCHEMNDAYSICNLGLDAITYKVFTPYWDDVYYKDIKVWNRNATDISSINSFGSPLNNEITMNIISYHPFTIDTIKPGIIKSLVTFMNKDVDFISRYNTERVYDNSQQINWVTGYDITFPDKYISSLNVSSYTDKVNTPYFSKNDTSFDLEVCKGNCYQCFSGSEDDCISCKIPYLISGKKCTNETGYYFKIPSSTNEKIILYQNLSDYKQITIMFFMKFYGSIEQRMGIVPILFFYKDTNYLGWDIEKQTFVINILNESLIEDTIFSFNNSRLFIGKWSFFSISIFISDYPEFPNMIQFMIDENTIQPCVDITNLNKKIIKLDKISINNKMNALFYDLRIYNKFFIGAYGIGQGMYSSSYSQSLLIKRFSFKSSSPSSNDCIEDSNLIETDVQCLGDNNPYDDPNLVCDSGKIKIINVLNNEINCIVCDDYCDINYCTYNTTKNCMCINDDRKYWLRYNFEEEKQKFYCEKLDSINLNEYNDIIINNIGIGSNTGYMIELWFYVESYIDNSNFKGVSIIWKNFIKIDINYLEKDIVKIDCYPYSENNTKFVTDKKEKFGSWIFYRCQVDRNKNKVSSLKSSLDIKGMKLWSESEGSTTLVLKDNSESPYGVFLIRELRIYSERNTELTDVSHLNLDISKYISLIHYFKANFTDIKTPRNILYDYVTNRENILTFKFTNYSYSYISNNYTELILCEEGFEYKKNTEGIYECLSIDQNDLIDRLSKDDNIYTTADLLSKIDNIYNMAVGDFNYTGSQITTSIFNFSNEGKINIQDPTISDNYCSHKGIIQIVQTSLACYCIGDAVGKYCHLKAEEYTSLESMYELFFKKAQKTFTYYSDKIMNKDSEEGKSFIISLNNLVQGNQLFCKDASFVTEFTFWMDKEVIKNIKHCDLDYIKLVDNLFSTLILLTNTYKAGLISNNKGTKRNANLNSGQEEEIDSNILFIKKHLEYLTSLCFENTVDGLWTYQSDNIHVDLFKVPKNGNINIDEFMKSLKEAKHEPYFQFIDCLNTANSLDDSQNLNIQYITWIFSPWYHHNTLNYNYSSNYVEIKLYSDDLNELQLKECKDDSKITFYLALTNPELIDIINNNKFHFKEGNLFKSDDRIFTEPKYILDDGSVSNMTIEERRDKYYFEYLLVYKNYEERSRELITTNVKYDNLEDNLYFRCSSSHLSEYLLTYEYNPKPNKILGRFYFLKHFKLYINSENLKGNYGFFAIIIVLGLYFINFLTVKLYLLSKKKKLGNKNYLLIEDFLINYVYPYGNIEGDFFVNKENLNKIYNNSLKIKKEKEKMDDDKPKEKNKKDLLKLKQNFMIENSGINEEKDKRKNAYLNENNLMNYGDVKNKKIYEQYYNEINEEGYNDDNDEINDTLGFQKRNNKNEEDESPSDEILRNRKIKEKKKLKKREKMSTNNYIKEDDNISNEEKEEEIKEVKEFNKRNKIKIEHLIHSLQISNENLRIRILSKMKVNNCQFFTTNLKNRIILLNTFNGNYTYSASIKALCFPLYLLILLFINTFIFICLNDESESMDYIKGNIGDFIWRCLVPIVVVNIYFYLTRYFYNLENGEVRYLLYEFKTNKKSFDKHYFNILKKIKNMMIIETILFIIMSALSYIFVFGLFAVYPSQGKTMFISLICGVVIDFLLQFIFEIFITILFMCRKNHVIVILLDYLNRLLSYKMLSP